MTREVEQALLHVKVIFPEVEIVIYNKAGMWQYMTADFYAPIFNDLIIVDILEKAADSVTDLPAIFQL